MNRQNFTSLYVALAASLIAGCNYNYDDLPLARTQSIAPALQSDTAAYPRVAVVAVWSSAAAHCDKSLTSADLATIARQMGEQISPALAERLSNKGYQPVGNARTISSDADLNALAPTARQSLGDLHAEYLKIDQKLGALAGAKVPQAPLDETIQTPLVPLVAQFSLADADAIVLCEATAYLETPSAQAGRNTWNWTGAPLSMAAITTLALGAAASYQFVAPQQLGRTYQMLSLHPTSAVEVTMMVIDRRTQKVLWWSGVCASQADARDRNIIQTMASNLVSSLPPLDKIAAGAQLSTSGSASTD